VYDWSDLIPLDYWISEMEALVQKYPSFPSPEIEARVTYGIFCAMMYRQTQHPNLPKVVERAEAVALRSGDLHLRTFLSSHLILYYSWWRGEPSKSLLLLNVMREQAKSSDIDPLSRIVWFANSAAHAWITGDNEQSSSLANRGLDVAEATGIYLWNFMLFVQCTFVALTLGDVEAADQYLQRMSLVTRTDRKGDIFIYYWLMGWKALCEGCFSTALEHEQTGLKFAREGGFPMGAATTLQGAADALIELGDFETSRKYLDEAHEFGLSAKSLTLQYQNWWLNAFFYLRLGDRNQALDALRQLLAVSREHSILNHAQWRSNIMVELYGLALKEGIEVEHVQKLIRVHRLVPTESQMYLDNWPWPLKIYTFGEFKILRDDKPLRYSRKAPKKPLELLRVMIALGGKNLSEQRLMDALWPDAEGDSGRNALSVTLSRLREVLGVKGALQVSEGMVSLDDRFVWTDVWAFERLIRAAERETERREDLEKAVELYRAHFLEGESGSWAISPRERLRESFLHAIESLGQYWEQRREWHKAVEVYRKGVQADDLIEKCYIRMMSCLLKLGSQAEALSVYRRLKKTLEGYGVEPSAEAEELRRQIALPAR
jgi:LuxR family maltose regulon positive regulatory protein